MNGLLLILLMLAATVIVVMKRQVAHLSHNVDALASSRFEQWKLREQDRMRLEHLDAARREAAAEFQQWKLLAEQDTRRDAEQTTNVPL
jgi:predicted Holliday junction resolvase-like endonuclease